MPRLTVRVYFAWWFPLYRWGIVTTCALTGAQPDWEKVEAVVKRALRYRVVSES